MPPTIFNHLASTRGARGAGRVPASHLARLKLFKPTETFAVVLLFEGNLISQ